MSVKSADVAATERLTFLQRIVYWFVDKGFFDKSLRKRAAALIEKSKIRKYLKPNYTYLDLGSGEGHIIEYLSCLPQLQKCKFLAMDPFHSPTRMVLSRIKARNPESVIFSKGITKHLPIQPKSLDGVFLFFVLHHIPSAGQIQIMKEVKRVLKKGGRLFLIEDTPENKKERKLNIIWDRIANFELTYAPHFYKSSNGWISFLKHYGFTLEYQSHFYSNSGWRNLGKVLHSSLILYNSS